MTTREEPSRKLSPIKWEGQDEYGKHWVTEAEEYYGVLREHATGFPHGGGPYKVLSISACDETARHDWRDFQQLKNMLVGEEWEAVEIYPAESNLKDPSNRFYLWCVPNGTFKFGLPRGRHVCGPETAIAPQRPFPMEKQS